MLSTHGGRRVRRGRLLCACALIIAGAPVVIRAQQPARLPTNAPDLQTLPIGETLEREMEAGETLEYRVRLRRGEVLRLDAEELGLDVMLGIGTSDERLLNGSDLSDGFGRETASFIANEEGDLLVIVLAGEGQKRGKLRLSALLKPAGARDRQRVVAEHLLAAAMTEIRSAKAVPAPPTLLKLRRAGALWRALGEEYWEAYCLSLVGAAQPQSNRIKALADLNSALRTWRALHAKYEEAVTLSVLTQLNGDRLGEFDALRSLSFMALGAGRRKAEAALLNRIADMSMASLQKEKTMIYSLAARWRPDYDDASMATMLGEMGVLQREAGDFQLAAEAFELALDYARAIGDRAIEAHLSDGLAENYFRLGRLPAAAAQAERALRLYQESGDEAGGAAASASLALIKSDSGARQVAAAYISRAAAMLEKLPDAGGYSTLRRLGRAYYALGEYQKALRYLGLALLSAKKEGIFFAEAEILETEMLAWHALGNNRLAVVYGKQAINLFQYQRSTYREIDQKNEVMFGTLDRSAQKTFLTSKETAYRRLAELLIDDGRLAEAQGLLHLLKDQQFFDFREDEIPLRYVGWTRFTGRAYLSFDEQPELQIPIFPATERESRFSERYHRLSQKIEALRLRLTAEIKEGDGVNSQLPDNIFTLRVTDRLEGVRVQLSNVTGTIDAARMRGELAAALGEFEDLIWQTEAEFALPPSAEDRPPAVESLSDLQAALNELGRQTGRKAVAIYTLVGERKYSSLIVTAEGITSVGCPVEGARLNEKALELWALLKTDGYDPRKAARGLYALVFEPLEASLPEDTQTILWSLDGNLRYVPMAALFDGSRYLVERYDHVILTRADRERLTRDLTPEWTGSGFGTARPHDVQADRTISFGPLPAVPKELGDIFRTKSTPRGLVEGHVWEDAAFTKSAFLGALKRRRPLVHIASHFAFRPGNETLSFLVLGDGSVLNLEDMKHVPDLFAGVELLTLSACDTAAHRPGANGREIEEFAELAQRQGAAAVLASLWSVADESTATLMAHFYGSKRGGTSKLTKAEALREAQLALLRGESPSKPPPPETDPARSWRRNARRPAGTRAEMAFLRRLDAAPFRRDPARPYAHPYYWSPFVLFGNWR
jgi:CHAT domain-containing protein/tetratricopeptide (TPR) repeat protein